MDGERVKVFKALADATRLEILQLLARRGEMSCRALSTRLPLSQPTLSHHFRKLVAAGILRERKSGARHFYRINLTTLRRVGLNLARLTTRS